MLSKRYEYDGKPILGLNSLQLAMKEQITRKIEQNHYVFERVPCCACNKDDFELLSSKDRYGLYMPVVVCKECGLVQTNPRMSQQSYKEFYASEYRKLYLGKDTPGGDYSTKLYERGKQIYKYVKRHLDDLQKRPPEMFVLEVGCGSGEILRYFKEMGYGVCGVDLDEDYVEYGRKKYGLDLRFGTLANIVVNRAPDLVIYSHVLEHLLNPVDELRQLSEMLEEGLVFVAAPGIKHLAKTHFMDFLRFLQIAHTYHFTLTSLSNVMRAAGFFMACGNERIWSVFRRSAGSNSHDYVSDHKEVTAFLRRMERLQRFVLFKNALRQAGSGLLKLFPGIERKL